jgi:vancomycin permeability regulator SanA
MSLIWNVREQFATVAALVDVYVSRPQPILGEPQPMFSTRSSDRGAKLAGPVHQKG